MLDLVFFLRLNNKNLRVSASLREIKEFHAEAQRRRERIERGYKLLAMRVMPFLIKLVLKLINKPRRLLVRRR